jgi:hypothetical protein
MKSAGVSVLRVSLGWDGLEPERGRYDLEFWDGFFAETAAAQIRVIPYVAYTPRWNSSGGGDDFWRRPPVDLGAFAETMTTLARRYRGSVGSWEIWNEPDNPDYWRGTAAQFGDLLLAGARAVRAANPQAKVVFGGVAGHPNFAAEVLARPELAPLVDVVNAHAYFETWNGAPIESLPSYITAFAPVLAGGTRSLWLAEVGYSNFRRGSTVSADYRARFSYEHTLDFQAVALVRTVTLALTRPEVSLLAWYELKDPPPGAPVIGDDNNRHLGVAFSDWRPKPALAALALVERIFGRGFRRLDDRLRVARPPGARAEVHAFLTTAHQAVIVAWLPTGAGAGGELPVERVSLTLAATPSGPIRWLDAEGHERKRSGATSSPSSGDLELEALELRGGDLTLLEIPVAAFPGDR